MPGSKDSIWLSLECREWCFRAVRPGEREAESGGEAEDRDQTHEDRPAEGEHQGVQEQPAEHPEQEEHGVR